MSHELLTFMDVFSGYNQIRMVLEDEEKIAFIIDQNRVMPFDLKMQMQPIKNWSIRSLKIKSIKI